MSHMDRFYKLLTSSTAEQDDYVELLKVFRKVNLEGLWTLTADLVWQVW